MEDVNKNKNEKKKLRKKEMRERTMNVRKKEKQVILKRMIEN